MTASLGGPGLSVENDVSAVGPHDLTSPFGDLVPRHTLCRRPESRRALKCCRLRDCVRTLIGAGMTNVPGHGLAVRRTVTRPLGVRRLGTAVPNSQIIREQRRRPDHELPDRR